MAVSHRVGWTMTAYLTLTTIFVTGLGWEDVTGLFARHIQVDSSGELAVFGNSPTGWMAISQHIFIPIYACFFLAWVIRLVVGYRRATGVQRAQLKWLFTGGAICIAALIFGITVGNNIIGDVAWTAIAALPIGVGILRHRLYEIDKLISRTISYLIITGPLAGRFIAIVVVATWVLPFSSPVAVAASTLAAAALFNPLRMRVQRLVDRRFNRARYDAEAIIAAFTLRLRDAVDLDTVRGELLLAVERAVEPTHASVWIRPTR